jgi:hypothetical protein
LFSDPAFNQTLRVRGFKLRIKIRTPGFQVPQGMTSNLMTPFPHFPQQANIILTPIHLSPFITVRTPIYVNWASVGGQEESCWESMLVEDGNRTLELASQSVIEGEGTKCRFVHKRLRSRATCIDEPQQDLLLGFGWVFGFSYEGKEIRVGDHLTCRDAKEIIVAVLLQLPELARYWGRYDEGFLELDEDMSLNLK